jgi:hypothetical protein
MNNCVAGNIETEINFVSSILRVLNEYIENKTLNIMEQRFDNLRSEIDKLIDEIGCSSSSIIDIVQPISISSLDDVTAMSIMDEVGSYGLEMLGDEGVYVKLRLTD